MPNMECLVGQLIASVTDLKDEMKELKLEMKELRDELRADTAALEGDVDKLISTKDKGTGFFLAVAGFCSFLSWATTFFILR